MDDAAIAIARFTNLHMEDEAAHDALRQALIAAREPQPQGLLEGMAANWLDSQGKSWAVTPAGQERLRIAKSQLAARGAEAYVHGWGGNAYTQHLRTRFGPYQGARPNSYSGATQFTGDASTPSGNGFFAEAAKTASDLWTWYRSQHEVVQGTIAVIYVGIIALILITKQEMRSSPFDWLLIAFGAGIFTAMISIFLIFFVGVGVRIREWSLEPAKFREGFWGCLKIGAWASAIGAGAGLLWWLVATAGGNDQRTPPAWAYVAGGVYLILCIPVLIGFAFIGEAGFGFLEKLTPTRKKNGESEPTSAAVSGSAAGLTSTAGSDVPSPPTFTPSTVAPPTLAPPATPAPAEAHAPANILAWAEGCLTGDRMGKKTFRARIATELAPLDVLAQASRLLMQLHYVQPWRVNGQVRSHASEAGVSITAVSSYEWDNSPYYAEENGKIVLVQSISGQTKRGSGAVHLECAIFGEELETHVVVQIEFSEPTYPMWLKRQSEGMAALTLLELGKELAAVLNADITWEFVGGDWTAFQVIGTPLGSLTIRRARGH